METLNINKTDLIEGMNIIVKPKQNSLYVHGNESWLPSDLGLSLLCKNSDTYLWTKIFNEFRPVSLI